jgi:hypothetical protein
VHALNPAASYIATCYVKNACGPGRSSPISASLRILDCGPPEPTAPVLEVVDETSLRVFIAMPPKLPLAPEYRCFFLKLSSDRRLDGSLRGLRHIQAYADGRILFSV